MSNFVYLEPLMRPLEVCKYLSIEKKMLQILVQKNLIPVKKIGTQFRFSRKQIDMWLDDDVDVKTNILLVLRKHLRKAQLKKSKEDGPLEA